MFNSESQTAGKGYTNKPTEEAPNNYPPGGIADDHDTTSEGGYGGQAFTQAAQRGLIDQSTEGIPLGDEIQDAYQGKDAETTAQYKHEQSEQTNMQCIFMIRKQQELISLGQGLNHYGESAADDTNVQEDRLASSYTDGRARKYEGGTISSSGFDADT